MQIPKRTKTTFAVAGALLLVGVVASAQNLDVKGTLTAEGLGGGYHFFGTTNSWRSVAVGGNGGTDLLVAGNLGGRATLGAHNGAQNAWADLSLNGYPGVGGNVLVPGNLGIGTTVPAYRLDVSGDVHATGWLRTTGNTGWYSQTYGGGWYMSDPTWIRTYGAGSVWVGGNAVVGGNLGIGSSAPAVKLAVNGNGTNVYATDAWVENNLHVQGNEGLVQGGRGRLRVGTAWGYVGMYAETSTTGAATDLVLGASSGQVYTPQNLFVAGRIRSGGGVAIYKSACTGDLTTSTACSYCNGFTCGYSGTQCCSTTATNSGVVGRLVDP